MYFNIAKTRFGNFSVRCETDGDEKCKWIDIILYKGEEKSFNLNEIGCAYTGFALSVGKPLSACSIYEEGERLRAEYKNLAIYTYSTPTEFNQYIKNAKGFVDGKEY